VDTVRAPFVETLPAHAGAGNYAPITTPTTNRRADGHL